MKKIACIFLIFALITAFIPGCEPKNKSGAQELKSKQSVMNEYGWEVPEETIEITYYGGKDNPEWVKRSTERIHKYIFEKFNVRINKIVYDAEMDEILNLMLASGDYPEVIAGMYPDDAALWVKLGKAIELSPYIEEYGQNIKNKMGKYLDRLRDENGNLYMLAVEWGMLPIADYAVQLRWDWYKGIGSPEFSTPDEYYEVLKKMTEKHPLNMNGEKVYALGVYKNSNIIRTLGGVWGLKDGWKEDEDHNLTFWTNTQEGLEMAKYLNRFYREGLMDPDSFVNTYDDWCAKCINERYAGFIGSWWVTGTNGHEAWQKIKGPEWNDDMRFVHFSIKAPDAETAYTNPKNTLGWGRTIITDKCEQPANIVKWWNFEISDLGNKLISWGIPNEEYSAWNYDGESWSWNEKQKSAIINQEYFDWETFFMLGSTAYWMVMGKGYNSDGTSVWFDQNFREESKWFKFRDENLKDTIFDFSEYYAIVYSPDDPITIKKQQVDNIINSEFAKAVMAKTEKECEKIFMDLREKVNKMGLGDIEDFVTGEYKENMEAWN